MWINIQIIKFEVMLPSSARSNKKDCFFITYVYNLETNSIAKDLLLFLRSYHYSNAIDFQLKCSLFKSFQRCLILLISQMKLALKFYNQWQKILRLAPLSLYSMLVARFLAHFLPALSDRAFACLAQHWPRGRGKFGVSLNKY